MDKHPLEKGIAGVIGTYELLDRVRRRGDLVIRDDQFDYEILLEAIRNSRRRKSRLRLVDTGRFEAAKVEWLIREGAHFHTSDEARPDSGDLFRFLRTSRKTRSRLAFFLNGPFGSEGDGAGFSPGRLRSLLEEGMDLHLTNRSGDREFAILKELAESARTGKGSLVYYHHGLPEPGMVAVASGSSWIHLSDRDISDDEGFGLVLETAAAASAGGARLAVHIEKGLSVDELGGLWQAGAVLLFKTPPSDDRSLIHQIERRAARRRLPARAFYLTTDVLP
jgi:hypothetical protein